MICLFIYYFQLNGGLEDTYPLPCYNHNISNFECKIIFEHNIDQLIWNTYVYS